MEVITGEYLKRLRKEAGLSQAEVARLASVSQAHIAKIETGRVDPRLSTVNRILFVLSRNKRTLRCGEVMRTDVVYAKPDDRVEKVIKTMHDMGISQLPVFHRRSNTGSVSETAILRNFERRKRTLYVRDVMEKPFPVLDSEDGVDAASSLLDFYPAVLVSVKGRIKGIITKSDLLEVRRRERRVFRR